jgi:hypothetical protein
VGEVLEMADEDLLKIRNFGEKSLVELQEKLAEHGITNLAQDADSPGATPSFSTEELSDLMDSGGNDDAAGFLPTGMTFEDASLSDSTVELDEGGLDYEELD